MFNAIKIYTIFVCAVLKIIVFLHCHWLIIFVLYLCAIAVTFTHTLLKSMSASRA